ncbi:MAG: hypothetical protein JWP41_4229 [Ramlibacter sp.]|nr:hypothetical protein [Ramlibacter sp.]
MPSYTESMKAVRLALLSLACSAPLLASAQWQWLDKDGRKVFSDRPPPADIAPNRIVTQPGVRLGTAETTAAAPPTAAASNGLAVPKLSGVDKTLDDKRKQILAAEGEKKKADEAKLASARTENCSRAKATKANFDSGRRIARTDEKGERVFLDDNQRAAEARRVDEIIAKDCVQ